MISLILAKKILSLFLVMALGIVLVRCGIVRSQDSKVLSMISLYLVMPCVIISSFQVEYQPEILNGLLLALATGMRPAKLYNGTDSAICGFLFVTGEGEVLCYQRAFRQTFADFLFQNSRLEKGSTEKDKYGYLERENGVYYFKLNLKIGLLKR